MLFFLHLLWNFPWLNCFKKYLRLPNHTTAIIPFINCFYCIWKRPKSLYPLPKRSWVYDIKHLSNCIFVSNKVVVNAQIHVFCRFCSSCRDVVNKIARTIIHAIKHDRTENGCTVSTGQREVLSVHVFLVLSWLVSHTVHTLCLAYITTKQWKSYLIGTRSDLMSSLCKVNVEVMINTTGLSVRVVTLCTSYGWVCLIFP